MVIGICKLNGIWKDLHGATGALYMTPVNQLIAVLAMLMIVWTMHQVRSIRNSFLTVLRCEVHLSFAKSAAKEATSLCKTGCPSCCDGASASSGSAACLKRI